MKSFLLFLMVSAIQNSTVSAQDTMAVHSYLQKINKNLPHQFKHLNTLATLEAMRGQGFVKVYLLIDDIEQYEQILIERSDEMGINFSQCGYIQIEKGKYKNNYIEYTDRYPVSPKMNILYRIKTIDAEGNFRMLPPVAIQQ